MGSTSLVLESLPWCAVHCMELGQSGAAIVWLMVGTGMFDNYYYYYYVLLLSFSAIIGKVRSYFGLHLSEEQTCLLGSSAQQRAYISVCDGD